MKKKFMLLVLILAFALVMGGAYTLYEHLLGEEGASSVTVQEREETTDASNNAQPAPDFTVEDSEGNSVSLSDMIGKPVVVNFWASWCGPCKSEMPDFETKFSEYGDEVVFMMVNMTDGSRETIKRAKAHVEEGGYTFPVYYDTQLSAAIAYGVNTIPATYFIDAEGRAVAYGLGALSESTIQRRIDMILNNP